MYHDLIEIHSEDGGTDRRFHERMSGRAKKRSAQRERKRASGGEGDEAREKKRRKGGAKAKGKTHACTECKYKAAWKSHLTRHMRTHTGDKPYACTKCNYKTAWKTALTRFWVHPYVHFQVRSVLRDLRAEQAPDDPDLWGIRRG